MALPLLVLLIWAIWATVAAYRRGRMIAALMEGADTAYVHNSTVIRNLTYKVKSLEEQVWNAGSSEREAERLRQRYSGRYGKLNKFLDECDTAGIDLNAPENRDLMFEAASLGMEAASQHNEP